MSNRFEDAGARLEVLSKMLDVDIIHIAHDQTEYEACTFVVGTQYIVVSEDDETTIPADWRHVGQDDCGMYQIYCCG